MLFKHEFLRKAKFNLAYGSYSFFLKFMLPPDKWCTRQDSNLQLFPWQGNILAIELLMHDGGGY